MPSHEKQRLVSLAKYVHNALRVLKMGETTTIACNKEYPIDEVRSYLRAYAFHKEKWFIVSYDATSRLLTATRAPPPPWDKEPEEPEEP